MYPKYCHAAPIDRLDILWTFRIMGLVTLLVTVPAAMLLRERYTYATATIDWYCHSSANRTLLDLPFLRSLIKDIKSVLPFLGSGIATFPLLVPPFLHTDVCVVAQYLRKFGFSASCPVQYFFRCLISVMSLVL